VRCRPFRNPVGKTRHRAKSSADIMDNTFAFIIAASLVLFFLLSYLRKQKKVEAEARAAEEKGKLHSSGPQSQHPHIDANYCIGCAACTMVCPEGDVLAMLGGKAVIVNGYKCIGHSLCAEVCPVGAITMVMASPSMGGDMPYLTPEYETSIKNVFIVGELGGLALIKNAINQGRDCVDNIARRAASPGGSRSSSDVLDVLIVGAGPAGISASLRAIEKKLNYITVDEGEMGGTVAKYPRQKLVMTSPVEFPLHGKFKKTELSKEELIAFWNKVLQRVDFKFRQGEKVEDIKKGEDGIFTVVTAKNQYRSNAVILALGKSGSPRKLGVKGEDLPKVMYRLIEADHYINKKILVVGGGDSAIEAAMGLGHQVGNQVTLSYRKEAFSRIKERNSQRIEESVRKGKVKVIFNSAPVEFKEKSVVLEVNGNTQELPNDYVWIFAGGEPPTAFLKKIGVGFGAQDLTSTGSKEAKQAKQEKQGVLVQA
jgi:thioredoxin reductase (NADPH)